MARKPAAAAIETVPPAMDYAQHEGTYAGFLAFLKWSIVSLVFVMLSLYAFIQAHNAIIGIVLLILSVVVPIAGVILTGRRPTAA